MKAMVATAHGGPEVLEWREVPEPQLREHDLLVRVRAAAVNPVDCKIRQGVMGERELPLVLGFDVSGVVERLGPSARGFQPGDEVYASPNLFRAGANAELVAVDSRSVAPKPRRLSHEQAAALPLVTLTAWEALYQRARLQPGETVLVQGGAGGVGHVAVQLAKLRGCRVIATAGREESIAFCRDALKADDVIDYRSANVAEAVHELTAGEGCDVVFDTVGDPTFETSLECVAINGRVAVILPVASARISEKLFLRNASLHFEFMGTPTAFDKRPEGQGEILAAAALLADSGHLVPHLFRTLPLGELAQAHRLQDTGHVMGKIAITIPA